MASIAEGRAMLIKNIAAMHRLFALALLLVATAASGPVFAAEAPTATIAEGRIGGAWEDGQRVFRGIPYAAPPVGERRWRPPARRSEEHTSELQSLMRISYAVFCLKNKKTNRN